MAKSTPAKSKPVPATGKMPKPLANYHKAHPYNKNAPKPKPKQK
jgi:hypothetical protein